MAKFCTECGSRLPAGVRFCPECGTAVEGETPAVVIPAPPGSTVTVSDTPPEAPRKAPAPKKRVKSATSQKTQKKGKSRKKNRACLFLAVVFVIELAVAGFRYPGFFRKNGEGETELYTPEDFFTPAKSPLAGVSSLYYTAEDYAGEIERYTVSPSAPVCEALCGVRVDFGKYCLGGEEAEVGVQPLPQRSDGQYVCAAYDLTLNGGSAEFAGLAAVTLSYDPAWGENVFVQYYNEDTGAWETLYTETDGAGHATFYTDHFCTFAVFKELVELGGTPGTIFRPVPGEDGRHTRVVLDYGALASYVRNRGSEDLSSVGSYTENDWAERGAGILGNYSSGMDAVVQVEALAAATPGAEAALGSMSKVLGRFGMVMTAGKLAAQFCRTGNLTETLNENRSDLVSLGLAAGSMTAVGSLAALCNVAGIAVFAYSMGSGVVKDISLQGAADKTEWAYRNFSNHYLVYNERTGLCSVRYVGNAWEDAQSVYDAAEHPLTTSSNDDYIEWKKPFDDAKKLRGNRGSEYIQRLIESCVNAFWQTEQRDRKTFQSYLKNTPDGLLGLGKLEDAYESPTAEKRKQYTDRYRSDLMGWLRPYIDELTKKAALDVLADVYASARETESALNEELTFTLRDPAPGKRYVLSASGGDGWVLSEENGYTVSCTRRSYLDAGSPAMLCTEGQEPMDVSAQLRFPRCELTLGGEAEETPQESPEDDIDDIDWNQSDADWGGDSLLTFERVRGMYHYSNDEVKGTVEFYESESGEYIEARFNTFDPMVSEAREMGYEVSTKYEALDSRHGTLTIRISGDGEAVSVKFGFTYVPEEEKMTVYSDFYGSEVNGWRKEG